MKRTLFNRRIHSLVRLGLMARAQGVSTEQAWENYEAAKESQRRRFTRREALQLALGAGMMSAFAACQTRRDATFSKQYAVGQNGGGEKVIIIGAGAAGLTCAYRLLQEGLRPILFEGSERLGGRIFTHKGFNAQGQFCELGAELVDSTNAHLIELAKELGLGLQAYSEDTLAHSGEESLFYFGGKAIRERAFFAALTPLLKDVAQDLKKIFGDAPAFFPSYKMKVSEEVVAYDNMSLEAYFTSKRGKAEKWLLDALQLAYETEYGGALVAQSSLNFLSLVDTSLDDGFTWYGASDEWGRVKGGNSVLMDALGERLKNNIAIELGHELESIRSAGSGFSVSFRVGASSKQIQADRVVFALPFSVLRDIEGAQSLVRELSQPKQESIRKLSYGTNAKYMVGFTERYWRNKVETGQLPPSQAAVLSDLPSGQFWETTRAQAGADGSIKTSDPGILTNFLGGTRGAQVTTRNLDTILADANTLWPGIKAKHDQNSLLMPWAQFSFARGSYSSPGVGQYTSFIGSESEPELDGRLHFVGEHTSADWLGFMEGAIESGTRAARAIAGATQSRVHEKTQTHLRKRAWKQRA